MRSSAEKIRYSALCVFLCAGAAVAAPYGEAAEKIAAGLGSNSRVAVLPFLYIGEEENSRGGQVVSERLATELAGNKNIKLLERSLLTKVLGELKLQGGALFDEDEAGKAGKLLAADYVVIGSLFRIKDGALGLNVRAVETETGRIKSAAYVKIAEDWIEKMPEFPGGVMPDNANFRDCWAGRRALDGGDKDKAVELFSKAIAADRTGACGLETPGFAYFGRGAAYAAMDEYEMALKDLDAAIKADPRNSQFYLHRARVYTILDQDAKALADYGSYVRLNPEAPEGYLRRGLALALLKKDEAALKDLTRAIDLGSREVEAYCVRAGLLAFAGKYEKAEADLDKAAELAPDLPEIYFTRGTLYARQRRWEKAREAYDSLVELEPWNAKNYFERGGVLAAQRKFDGALADLSKAIELSPDYAPAYCSRGILYRTRLRNKEALADFDRAIGLKEDYVTAYAARAYAYLDTGRPGEAVADMDKVIKLERPLKAERYFDRGVMLGRMEDYGRALADFNKYIKLAPGKAAAYQARGFLFEKLGQPAKARADYKKYAELAGAGK